MKKASKPSSAPDPAQGYLPYGRQGIDEDDIAAVAEALRADFLTTGPKAAEFEQEICKATGAKESVVCSNGTTALHLAMLALGVGEGDAVIVPTLTFLATANAVRYCGAEVVFADIDPRTGMIGVPQVEEALKRAQTKPKAIVGVHLGGHCCDLEGLAGFAKKNGMKFMADACHALGGTYKGKPVGACEYETLSTFSFHPVKAIATGEGGAITTNDPALAARMRLLRSHGMEKKEEDGPWCYEMAELGYNYRLTDVQCALGISQIRKLGAFIARRRELAARYDELFRPLANRVGVPARSEGSAWHLYAVRMDFESLGITRADVMNRLKGQGIGTQVHYIPVHTQPYYRARYGDLKLPGAEAYYEGTLSLPLFSVMTESDAERVVKAISEILQ